MSGQQNVTLMGDLTEHENNHCLSVVVTSVGL